jgi:hypothetical protein
MSITDDEFNYSANMNINNHYHELAYWLNAKDVLMSANKENAILVCAHATRWLLLYSNWESIRGTCPNSFNSTALANILKISHDDMLLVFKTSIISDALNINYEHDRDESDDESDDEDVIQTNDEKFDNEDDPC